MTRLVFLLTVLAAACAASSPAPISFGQGAAQDSAPGIEHRTAPETQTPAQPQPQAQPNWADGEGTPLSAYALQPSQAQPFDPANLPRTHRVSGNESLYDIATRYQVPLRALIDQNQLEPPYALSDGRILQLPPPRFHVVRRGEQLSDIAQRYNVDLRSLALLNRIEASARVRAGERIYLPAMAREAPAAAAEEHASGASPPLGSGPFAWPLRGEVLARFGPQPGGTRLDGIEIAGREGARVISAADGDVIYAGADIEGLGTLVLIRHADNYVTAYGHNRRALVREGERVRAGQEIAELGAAASGRTRLLFEVRRGNQALDPAPLLGPPR